VIFRQQLAAASVVRTLLLGAQVTSSPIQPFSFSPVIHS
jgi:hypothetical protein